MNELCLSMLAFMAQIDQLPKIEQCPEILLTTRSEIAQHACENTFCSALAYYHREKETIYIDEELEMDTPLSSSILLHELVHYAQDMGGTWGENTCQQSYQREFQAFKVQEKYLYEQGHYYPVSRHLMGYACLEQK